MHLCTLHSSATAEMQAALWRQLSPPPDHFLPPAALLHSQAGARDIKKRARADARGVARKAIKLLGGPLLEAAPALAPRAAPLLAAALLVSQGCGPKVAAAALQAACQLHHPLLSALRGLPQPREEGADEAPAPKSAKKGKKDEKAAAKEAQRAAERKTAAADAAYNARVVAALASRAAGEPAAAATLVELLSDAGAGELPGATRAEPLALLVAHAAVQQGGAGGGAVAVAMLQQLQKAPASAAAAAAVAADALPAECFEGDSGVATGALLERFAAGQLSSASLRCTTLLAALQAAPWAQLAPRGNATVRGGLWIMLRVRLSKFGGMVAPEESPQDTNCADAGTLLARSQCAGGAAAAAHAVLAALAARPGRAARPPGARAAGRRPPAFRFVRRPCRGGGSRGAAGGGAAGGGAG